MDNYYPALDAFHVATSPFTQSTVSSVDHTRASLYEFRQNVTVSWNVRPFEILDQYLKNGARVRFVPWHSLLENTIYEADVVQALSAFEQTYGELDQETGMCIFPYFQIPDDCRGPFAGFTSVNAGCLEVEIPKEGYALDETCWVLAPLTPHSAFGLINQLYAYGWNPATGKLDSVDALALSRPLIPSNSLQLLNVLDFAVKQGLRDITSIDMQCIYPNHIAYHYRGLVFSEEFAKQRRQTLHIKLETRPGSTDEQVASEGLDAVIVKARASRNGLMNFVGYQDDLAFTKTLLHDMGLTGAYLDSVELLDSSYVEEYYENMAGWGFNLC
ncbi:hypothetical protein H2198_000692 [Neophaeococcomyces mojaviensis]|uniref:Uncharacterized protein n=1 Tax=Neophaeococcomyces mojaviensis TaxID=3383035 RepID=A0ACC3AJ60_9EURO|nr:hypothetical protein H2198_000692 [Knufia sp. JES_112]